MKKVGKAIFFYLFLFGCAVKVVEIKPDFKLNNKKIAQYSVPELNINSCLNFLDSRKNSVAHFKDLSKLNTGIWIENAINRISNSHINLLKKDDEKGSSKFRPTIILEKAYVKHMATSISGVVVISFHGKKYSNFFRGQYVKLNWWGAKSEYEFNLDQALVSAVLKFWKDERVLEEISAADC